MDQGELGMPDRPLTVKSSNFTSGRLFLASKDKPGTYNESGQYSKPHLHSWLRGDVARRSSIPATIPNLRTCWWTPTAKEGIQLNETDWESTSKRQGGQKDCSFCSCSESKNSDKPSDDW